MICPNCNSSIPEQSLFCHKCGCSGDRLKNRKSINNIGYIYSNVSNASTISGEVKFNAERGHGFAAERANHLYDKLNGKNAKIVGDDNAKNGADRLVDGVAIQSKYCSSGSKCIQECFEDGKYKYINADGSPMQVEVPSDKYDDAVRAMEERIRRGQVPGVDNPQEAKNLVRKGHFTYEQAKNIAKFGTVESLIYDAGNGAIIGTTTFGITAIITFAVGVWNGDGFDKALHNAIYSGLKVGGVSFATAILSGQMTKAGGYGLVANVSEEIVRAIGPKASAVLVNAFRSGTNIYGAAAMKSAQKLIGSNIVTGVASVVVLSTFDIVNTFRGRISGAQLFKNLVNTSASVAGGTAGWSAGATAGAYIGSFIPLPGIGTAAGAIAGGLFGAFAGGSTAGKVANAVTDEFIEDDANEMINIIEEQFKILAVDYLLNQNEVESIVDILARNLDGSTLKDMYASSNREEFARNILIRNIEVVVKRREFVKTPSEKEMIYGLKSVLEEMA